MNNVVNPRGILVGFGLKKIFYTFTPYYMGSNVIFMSNEDD